MGWHIFSVGREVVTIPSERFTTHSASSNVHKLIEHNELKSQFQDITEGLNRVAEGGLVCVYKHHKDKVESNDNDVDVYEICHNASPSNVGFQSQEPSQRPNV